MDDFYQGMVPAAVPYFMLERHFSYLGASGLALAATLGSALPQLGIGIVADRYRAAWLAPFGLSLAGVGAGLSGLATTYPVIFGMLLFSGIGVAMFHPPAGRDARLAAGGSATGMSYFAAGGTIGFFAAPALATPALDGLGLRAMVLFLPPAVMMGFVLLRRSRRVARQVSAVSTRRTSNDRVVLFIILICVEVVRSAISSGVSTFVTLYWIRYLGAGNVLGGLALAIELAGAVLGTLLGGLIGDRYGMVCAVRLGNTALPLAMIALLCCEDKYAALPLIALVGMAINIPFAVLVKLGQDYLPSRPGTATGVTLGLAVSAGGLFLPLLGLFADHYGPRGALVALSALPVVAVVVSLGLREP
ncbi:MFS transporter [Amycolatopsis sp. lyj-23]|uniref:MFS transporter n=1 Tax=Amycolatopsis sp. lyj-23 TaxID=2789283 RepID=UPI00397B4ED9